MLGKIAGVLSILSVVAIVFWFAWDLEAQTDKNANGVGENKQELRGQQEQIQILTDIHTKQQAADEAKEELIRELCRLEKLPDEDCPSPPPQ